MATQLHTGKLITFEGGEGGGKTTQLAQLHKKLQLGGYDVIVLREPGGTSISEQIREVVLSPQNKEIAFTTEVLLFQAARAQIYHEVVKPALEAGKIVLIDRSRDSSVVYQGVVRGFGVEFIEQLNGISTQNIVPNLTILLDVDVDEGLRRRALSGKQDRLDAESKQFHSKVRHAYLDLATQDTTGRWRVIDANQELVVVAKEIEKLVLERVKKYERKK